MKKLYYLFWSIIYFFQLSCAEEKLSNLIINSENHIEENSKEYKIAQKLMNRIYNKNDYYLYLAIDEQQKDIFELLVKNGFDVNTDILYKCLNIDLYNYQVHFPILKTILNNGKNLETINPKSDYMNNNIFNYVHCLKTDFNQYCELFELILNTKSINFNHLNQKNIIDCFFTELLFRFSRDNQENKEIKEDSYYQKFKFLLDKGANVDCEIEGRANTGLFYSLVLKNSEKYIQLFLEYGANTEHKGYYGTTIEEVVEHFGHQHYLEYIHYIKETKPLEDIITQTLDKPKKINKI